MSTLETLAAQTEAGIGFSVSSPMAAKFIMGAGGTSVLPLRLPVRVRDQRFEVHDGITLYLGAHEAELRLPPGVDVQPGDTISVMLEIKHSGCGQSLVRQARVLKINCDEAVTEAGPGEDGLFLYVVIHWEQALHHWIPT